MYRRMLLTIAMSLAFASVAFLILCPLFKHRMTSGGANIAVLAGMIIVFLGMRWVMGHPNQPLKKLAEAGR